MKSWLLSGRLYIRSRELKLLKLSMGRVGGIDSFRGGQRSVFVKAMP